MAATNATTITAERGGSANLDPTQPNTAGASGITYRRMTWSDVDAVVKEFDDTWGDWSSAAGTPSSIMLSRHFVLHYLEPATGATIAERDGRFMGVLIVRVPGRPILFPQAKQTLADTDQALAADKAHGAAALRETLQWHALETDLERDTHVNDTTQAEIELFLVAAAARGHGVGGTLWRGAMRDFAGLGVRRYYLHTDSSCDVSFYDHQGLDCEIAWYAADHPQYGDDMDDIFIYSGEVAA